MRTGAVTIPWVVLLVATGACNKEEGRAAPTPVPSSSPVASTPAASAPVPQSVAWTGHQVFRGKIDGRLAIAADLDRQGDAVDGTYFYASIGRPLVLHGNAASDGTLSLAESSGGKPTGSFRGTINQQGEISGTWSDAAGKKALPFVLTPIAPGSSPVRDPSGAPFKNIDAQLAKKEPGSYGKYKSGSGETEPRSCVEWESVRARKLEPVNNLEAQGNDAAMHRCRPLALVKNALPSERSFVAKLLITDDLPKVFPAGLVVGLSNEGEEAVKKANAAGQSWKAFSPTMHRTRNDASSATYEDPHGMGVQIQFHAFGDFDADGIEDLLLTTQDYATEGTLHFARVLILTRTTPDGLLRIIHSE